MPTGAAFGCKVVGRASLGSAAVATCATSPLACAAGCGENGYAISSAAKAVVVTRTIEIFNMTPSRPGGEPFRLFVAAADDWVRCLASRFRSSHTLAAPSDAHFAFAALVRKLPRARYRCDRNGLGRPP